MLLHALARDMHMNFQRNICRLCMAFNVWRGWIGKFVILVKCFRQSKQCRLNAMITHILFVKNHEIPISMSFYINYWCFHGNYIHLQYLQYVAFICDVIGQLDLYFELLGESAVIWGKTIYVPYRSDIQV